MGARETVLDYYEALRRGEPLYPYFAEHPDLVKFGIGERLTGYEAVAEGLREQTRTTEDWTVESASLRVVERGTHAWFSDDVYMAWTDTESGREYAFESRWSGTLEPRAIGTADDESADTDTATTDTDANTDTDIDTTDQTTPDDDGVEWLFVGMHVSAPHRTGDGE